MKTVKIFRYSPEKEPYWQEYRLEPGPDDMVLTVLNELRATQDATLAFRFSCRSAVCGSCAMIINGRPRLACQTKVRDLDGDTITLEPLTGMKVIKDLVVDFEPYWDNFKSIMPWLEESPDSEDLVITNKVSDLQEDICACILCGSCFAACPEASAKRDYLGPHALMEGYRFLHDPRDMAADKRLDVLAGASGAWGCDGAFACIGACPWHVSPVDYVAKIRLEAMKVRLGVMKPLDVCQHRVKKGDKK